MPFIRFTGTPLFRQDVECLSTLYIDKPIKAHTLMQAIARANRVYPGKDFGLIVDYNGMLRSLREALTQYALGGEGSGEEEIVTPIEERVQALIEAIEATETHLRSLGFDPASLIGSTGFARIDGGWPTGAASLEWRRGVQRQHGQHARGALVLVTPVSAPADAILRAHQPLRMSRRPATSTWNHH